MKNSIMVIVPYDYVGLWVFSDAATGLTREPFVAGAGEMITKLVERAKVKKPKDGFRLMFAATVFPGAQVVLDHVHEGMQLQSQQKGAIGADLYAQMDHGNTYRCEALEQEGWLCPALFKYFDEAPKHIYAAALDLGDAPEMRKQIALERKQGQMFARQVEKDWPDYHRPIRGKRTPWFRSWWD